RRLFYGLLAAEAAACAALCFTGIMWDLLPAALSFPFAQIGGGLRALSLAGTWGNAAAVLLYAALSLLPTGFLFYARDKRKLKTEDALLVLLSLLLFAALYLTANPGRLAALFGGESVSMSGKSRLIAVDKAVLGGTVYAVLSGYFILRALRAAKEGGTDTLYRLLKLVMRFLAFIFVLAIFAVCLNELFASFASLRAGNTGGGLFMSYAFLVFKFLTDVLPWALNIVIAIVAAGLLDAMRLDRYSEATEKAAKRLSKWGARSLAAIVLSNIFFNVLQLLFARLLHTVNGSLVIPLGLVVFVLFALLFARLTGENRRLKEDNELFI
ncbi:MAG TPA: hypothetical protein VN512_07775, partial [Clostridia bacterium]|nr:hypothetical protein [Clostridia bacterium]